LVAAGYRNTRGKPKVGQKALTPALAIIIGKSSRTIERYLAADRTSKDTPTDGGLSPAWKKRRASLTNWKADAIQQPNGDELVHAIDRVLELLGNIDRPGL
jgi:ParB family chromosome partitioning protein